MWLWHWAHWTVIPRMPFPMASIRSNIASMRNCSGWMPPSSLIIELRKDPATKHIPIMVVTGLTKGERRSPEEWRRVLDVEAFLQKPLKAEELLEAVKRVLLGKSA